MPDLEVQNNPFTSVLYVGAADPEALPDADPPAGSFRHVIDSTGASWIVDSTGNATAVGGVGGGAVATDAIWDAAGDLVQGTGADTGAKLSAGLAGQVLRSAGAAAANTWAYPPGYELDYAQITSNAAITATSGATAATVVSGASVTYDGSTIILIQFFCPIAEPPSGQSLYAVLYDGSTELGAIARGTATAAAQRFPMVGARRLTPSAAAHTYHVKGYVDAGTGTFFAGTGAAGAQMPVFIRITRV